MPFNLPPNFCINPETLLHRSRSVDPVESPPAPPPPRYNWRPTREGANTPDKTIRTIVPSSSHSLAYSSEPEPTNTPEVKTAQPNQEQEFFQAVIEETPIAPGGFVESPMSTSASSEAATVKGKGGMSYQSKDEIIEGLQERTRQLEREKRLLEARAEGTAVDREGAAVDRNRIEALEDMLSQLLSNRSPNTGMSGGSNNPFDRYRRSSHNISTPTPAGPRETQFKTNEPPVDDRLEPTAPTRPMPSSFDRPHVHRSLEGAALIQPAKVVQASDLKLSEVPKFSGPSESPAALFNWRRLIEQYFRLKNMTDNKQRLIVLGSVLEEPRAGAWYINSASDLRDLTWDEVMNELAIETLPTGWLEDAEKSIRQLKMGTQEDFKGYVGRARDLYNIVQVQTSLTPRNLAEYIVWGAPDVFQRWIKDRGLLLASPFKMLPFISLASNVWDVLVSSNLVPRHRHRAQANEENAQTTPRANQTANAAPAEARTAEQRADSAWRYHSYMRQQGLCGYCRTKCGNAQCRGPAKGPYVAVPDTFNPGPRPRPRQEGSVNPWIRPAATAPAKPPGAPTSKPAGRPVTATTLVASVEQGGQESYAPEVFAQDIARYEEADRVLVAHMAEENGGERCDTFPSTRTKSIILKMKINGIVIRALIDCAAETNLMSERINKQARIPRRPLVAPVEAKMAIEGDEGKAFFFKEFCFANVAAHDPALRFGSTFFKLAPLGNSFDVILGTPFLEKFHLDVSLHDRTVTHVPTQTVLREENAMKLNGKAVDEAMIACVIENLKQVTESRELSEREEKMLERFSDLFPDELPAVEEEDEEDFIAPEGQNESSKVRHKIVLTDPNVIINEKQYAYPTKYLTSWKKLIDQHLAAGRIRRSKSQYASPSMIIPKKDPVALPRWVCDYRTLNKYTVKDRSPLPNVDEAVRLVGTGKVFSIIDQINSFFQTKLREEDVPLTAVKTPFGLYEWAVMPMGLTNGPATHQARVEEALGDLIGRICVVYIDDIVVFSNSVEEHEEHVRQVLEKLRSARLYCSPSKSKLFRRKVNFLGHEISGDGICPDEAKVEKLSKWKTPGSQKQLLRFLGTVQFLKKFIDGLSHYVGTLSPLTSTKKKHETFKWGKAEDDAFENIKRIVTTLPVLKTMNYDSGEPVWLFTDASGHGLGAALFQGVEWDKSSPIAYESRTMTPAERNYPVHEQELLAVINALQKWKMMLLGLKINVMTDHHSLTHLLTQRNLSRRQARWLETLSQFDLDFKYLRGEDNTVADALSRVEEVASCEVRTAFDDETIQEIKRGYRDDPFCDRLASTLPLRAGTESKEGLLYVDNRLVIPKVDKLRRRLIEQTHEALGHLGGLKTLLQLRTEFFWPEQAKDVKEFVQRCDSCQRLKSRTSLTSGRMQATEVPRMPMEAVSLDFIGPFPKVRGYDMILSITCRLTGFVRAIPTCQTDTAEKTAQRVYASWLSIFGAPKSMIGDRDKIWTSGFWQELNRLLHIQVNLTTAYHPQSDGRSEKSNKTIVQVLRSWVKRRHGKWFDCLPSVEYAINSAVNVATGVSPFEYVYGRKTRLFPTAEHSSSLPDVEDWLFKRQSAWADFRDKLWTSRIEQAVHYNNRRRPGEQLRQGDWVLVDSKDRQQVVGGQGRPTSKLRPRYDGPYEVMQCLNDGRNFKLKLGRQDNSHPVFHISKLKKYRRDEENGEETLRDTGEQK